MSTYVRACSEKCTHSNAVRRACESVLFGTQPPPAPAQIVRSPPQQNLYSNDCQNVFGCWFVFVLLVLVVIITAVVVAIVFGYEKIVC